MKSETDLLTQVGEAQLGAGILPNGDPRVWNIVNDPGKLVDYLRTGTVKELSIRFQALHISERIFGKESQEFKITRLFCELAPHVDNILINQLISPKDGSSWADYSFKDAKEMGLILKEHKDHLPARLLSMVVWEKNSKELIQLAQKMDKLQSAMSYAREPMVYSTFFDDFVYPNRAFEEDRILWLANLMLLIPVPKKLDENCRSLADSLWSQVAIGFDIDPKSKVAPPVSLYFSVLGAGSELISPTVAQASEGRGIQVFINRFGKLASYWAAMEKLSHIEFTDDVFMSALKLFLAHEMGHDASNIKGFKGDSNPVFDESETDHLASSILLGDFLDRDHLAKREEVINAVFALAVENIYQILTSPQNSAGKFLGYDITAKLNLNALVDCNLIHFDFKRCSLSVNVHDENIQKFVSKMKSLHEAILNDDAVQKTEMLSVKLTSEANIIVNNFKQEVGRLEVRQGS